MARVSSAPFRRTFTAIALAGVLAPATARAADEVPPSADATPAEVSVRGERRVDPVTASDFDVPVGSLRDVPRQNAEQLLTLAPGLFLSNPSGEGHASSISLRGFDAGEGQDLEIKVDGVPINEPSNAHAHGYADTHFVIPELVDRLRVTEGPFDPRQGDFAVAGSVDYVLGLQQRGVVLKAGYGSFATRRLLALWGPVGMSRSTFAGFDYVASDGFGPNRAHTSTRAMAQVERPLGGGFTGALLATSYANRFDSAGVIREPDYRARSLTACPPDEESQFFCYHDPHQGGASARHGVALRLRKTDGASAVEQQAFATVRHLRIRQNLTGFLGDTSVTGEPQRGDGLEQTYRAVTIGARGSYAARFEALGQKQQVEIGYAARHDVASGGARRLRFADGAPYRVDAAHDLAITNIGLYGAVRLSPWRWLTVRGGVRVDTFSFAVVDENRPSLDRAGTRLPSEAIESFGVAVQPKVSIDVALDPRTHWMTSVGVGSRSSDAQALSQGELAPFARVTAAETGILANAFAADGAAVSARLVGYGTRVERDLVFDERQGRNTVIGASNRFGALAAVRFTSPFGIESQTSVTYAEAYLPPRDASPFDLTAGVRLPYVPRWVGRIDGALRRHVHALGTTFRYGVAAGFSYVGPRPLPFGELGPAYGAVDASARVRYRAIELAIVATNLFDRRNRVAVYNYASSFRGPDAFPSLLSQPHFAAGPPRIVMATLTFFLGDPDDDDS